jgi:cation transport ATPase
MKTAPKSYRFDAYHVLPDSPQMQRDFLYIAASLGARSQQPFAADIVRVAQINAILPVDVQGFQEFEGRGLGGLIQLPNEQRPRAVLIGTREFVSESGLQTPDILEVTARKWESEPGGLMLLAGWDSWVRGVMNFKEEDSVR